MEIKSHNKSKYPRVLVISHNCFSKSGSNGRTLGNLFTDWPKDSLSQFYISNEVPDSDVCDQYFRVTDVEALKAFYKGAKVGKVIKKETTVVKGEDRVLNNLYKRHRARTPFNYIVRNFIWDSKRWKSKEFEKWVNEFNPEIVLLQLGDYAFFIRMALGLASERNIPLVIYNSEDYYFKDKKSLSPLYNYFRKDYKDQYRKLISYATHSVYNSEMLQQTYQKEFQHQSSVVMTSTDVKPIENKKNNDKLKVSYLGNLGVGRHSSLIEIANALQEVVHDAQLDIYGNLPNEEVEKSLRECQGIRLKGFVSYDEVVHILVTSDLVVHAENFSDFHQWDLRHAFSTKIADSIASGNCFFVYAPENMACTRYLVKHNIACVVTKKENLKNSLEKVIKNESVREKYVSNALEVVAKNHQINKNASKFKNILFKVVEKVST